MMETTEMRESVESATITSDAQRIDYAALAPGALKVLLGVEHYVRQSGL